MKTLLTLCIIPFLSSCAVSSGTAIVSGFSYQAYTLHPDAEARIVAHVKDKLIIDMVERSDY